MKKHYLIFCLIFGLLGVSQGQITITQNDMPHPGDTTRLTNAQLNLFLNYSATGASHTWDFSNLRSNTQQLDSPMAVSATNFIYGLFYFNLPFNSNRASVAYKDAGSAINPLIPLTNPFGFYYLNSNKYEQVGLGAELLNFPTPIAFNNHDVIYNLPLNFGDTDTSDSNWGFGLNGVAYVGYSQTRTNHVDGWGTLITPHGTYDVLRVKTTRAQKDTVAIDSLNLNFALDRPLLTEYKWLANGETTPVLQINTQTFFGIEIISEILFIDDFLRIETNSLASNVICAGSTITVPYTKHGSFNGPALFVQGNKFTAQISDPFGNFANPINIGTVTSKVSGNITAVIPPAILPGNQYRIRVISSDPVVTGSDNGADLTIEYPVLTNINSPGPLSFCQPGTVELFADSGDGYAYQWQLNNTAISGATQANYFASQSGSYHVAVSNSCGTVNTPVLVVTANPLPLVQLNNTITQELCPGASLLLSATVYDALNMQWQLNGIDIAGQTDDSLITTQPGIYSLVATNACGTETSVPVTVVAGNLPTVTISGAPAILCPGVSALLTSVSTDAITYQWQLNGIAISGETNSSLTILQAGDYTLTATNNCGSITSTIVTVNAGLLPVVTITGLPVTLCEGDSTMLYATAINTLSYQWQLDGTDIPGAVDSLYFATASGNYSVIVSNNCGDANSTAINIIVNPAPQQPQITNGTDTLYASVAVSYQWYINGSLISGATSAYYIPLQNGVYAVVITDANGCTAMSAGYTLLNVGIKDNNLNYGISLYPNPVQNVLHINSTGADEINEIKISNVLGQTVLKYPTYIAGNIIQINTTDLKAGYYTVQVLKNGRTSCHFFIKN